MNKENKELLKKVRISRLKLQVEKLELESKIELAIASGDPQLVPFIKAAEEMLDQVQKCLDTHKLP